MSDASPKTWNPAHKSDVEIVAETLCCGVNGCTADPLRCCAERVHHTEAVLVVDALRKGHRLLVAPTAATDESSGTTRARRLPKRCPTCGIVEGHMASCPRDD